MDPSDLSALLDPAPLPVETGYERLPGGVLHVTVRTDLHGCTGAMLEWWFRWRCDTQKYVWWHPIDHVSSTWRGTLRPDTHVGSEHVVTERLTALPAADLVIQFRPPEEFFPPAAYAAARANGAISCAVLGRGGVGHEPARTPDGLVQGSRLAHVGRDTPWGLALRSHFFLGVDHAAAGVSEAQVAQVTDEEFGRNLLQHAYNEFTFLSRILPGLYVAEHRDTDPPPAPW